MGKRTALYEEHVKLGGRMVEFGGWEMPVQYTGLAAEHTACRTGVALFDVSHMGEFFVKGPRALDFVNHLVTNDVSKIADGQAQYTAMCNAAGGIVDDLVIYKYRKDFLLLVVNAANIDKDFAHAQDVRCGGWSDVELTNESAQFTQIAVQGPKAAAMLASIVDQPLDPIKTYWFTEGKSLNSIPTIIARTGYTGEDGFELYVPWNDGPKLWRALIEKGATPAGLGARDTLRLEMKYPLYGHELTDETNPLEVGLGWVTKLDKANFVGKAPTMALKAAGTKRALVGLKILEGGIARQGYDVLSEGGEKVGIITSGTMSPSLGYAIAIAHVQKTHGALGTQLQVQVRQTRVRAQVVETPFYKPSK